MAELKSQRGAGRPGFEKSHGLATTAFQHQASRIVLSREASRPLWQQLADQLENLILSGKLAPRSRMPSEPALCDLFGVSQPVIRSAIGALASRGLVVKMPRKGIFIGNPPRESGFVTTNVSLFDDMAARGARIRTKTYDLSKGIADAEECTALQLPEGEAVVRVLRVFWIDDQPITYTQMSFPAKRVPGFESTDIEGQSVLGRIRELFGRRVIRADRWFSAAMPSEEAQERMGVPGDEPLIWIESIGFEKDGSPLEYYRAYYNSKAARIHISVSD